MARYEFEAVSHYPGSLSRVLLLLGHTPPPPGMYTRNKQAEPAFDELFSHCLLAVFCNKSGQLVTNLVLSFLYVCMVNTIYLLSFVETPRKFIIAELSIRKLGSSSVL